MKRGGLVPLGLIRGATPGHSMGTQFVGGMCGGRVWNTPLYAGLNKKRNVSVSLYVCESTYTVHACICVCVCVCLSVCVSLLCLALCVTHGVCVVLGIFF